MVRDGRLNSRINKLEWHYRTGGKNDTLDRSDFIVLSIGNILANKAIFSPDLNIKRVRPKSFTIYFASMLPGCDWSEPRQTDRKQSNRYPKNTKC